MYQKWSKNPIHFVAMTGYRIEFFLELLPYFEKAHQDYFSSYDVGGKKKFVLYWKISRNEHAPELLLSKDRKLRLYSIAQP